jgi:hypothetical protein
MIARSSDEVLSVDLSNAYPCGGSSFWVKKDTVLKNRPSMLRSTARSPRRFA